MKLAVRLCSLCLLLSAFGAWATVIGSTNPAQFPNTIDWCAQSSFACDGGTYGTPQPFTSSYGTQGLVGLYFGQNFQVLQEGTSHFGGSYPDGMGLIYNGVSTLGNTPDIIAMLFTTPVWGAGAYIQTYYYGPFGAEVILLDSSFNPIGGNVVSGNSTDQPSDLVFVGATDTTQEVYGALFIAAPSGGPNYDVFDYSIGTVGLATPEPTSLLLMAPSMLGLIGIVRRRYSRKSQEVL